MSFEHLAPPPPGVVTAVIPGPGDAEAAALSPVLADAAAAGRPSAVVPAEPAGAGRLPVATNLRASGPLPRGSAREAWLRPVGELAARLDRPWRDLCHAERYLAEVARARLAAVDLIVLELPASRLAGRRVVELVRDLASDGVGVLWLERRLNLVAAVEADAWLLDGGTLIGPLQSGGLPLDLRARRLAFGGRLPAR